MDNVVRPFWEHRYWKRYEGPTWLLAFAIYATWASLLYAHAHLAWWIVLPIAAYLVAWHSSLQHETIHAMTHVPRYLRVALAALPVGIWLPYAVYCREHRQHHNARHISDALLDPESYYHDERAWSSYPAALRAVFWANQTLFGRMTIGPMLQLSRICGAESARIRRRDFSNVPHWAVHFAAVTALLAVVQRYAHMPWWQYVLLFAYPGLSLGMLRSFGEHRANENFWERTAVVESRGPLSLLYLNNNLHLVHHLYPSLPWYDVPRAWRSNRRALLQRNNYFYFSGYTGIVRRWLVRPISHPVQRKESPEARREITA